LHWRLIALALHLGCLQSEDFGAETFSSLTDALANCDQLPNSSTVYPQAAEPDIIVLD
jgi:hypothetical protein